jgi:hypothetical protein
VNGRGPWLVSARWDVAVFGGSALLAFGLLLFGRLTGALDGAVPAWTWIATVVFVDVAHVWATAYRVYLDPDEMRRRPALYLGLPLAAYMIGVGLYSVGSASLFWRVLAYVAVFHFMFVVNIGIARDAKGCGFQDFHAGEEQIKIAGDNVFNPDESIERKVAVFAVDFL